MTSRVLHEHVDPRQRSALDELERGSAAGGHVVHGIQHAQAREGGDAVAPAHHGQPVAARDGRAKPRNMQAEPRVSISIWDRDDHYRVLNVRGRVVESTTEGADDHARWLNRKYHGDDDFSFTPGTVRIIFKIEPESITRSS